MKVRIVAFSKYSSVFFCTPGGLMQAVCGIKMFFSANGDLHRTVTIRGLKMFGQFIPQKLVPGGRRPGGDPNI
jgi:hypothetical protein